MAHASLYFIQRKNRYLVTYLRVCLCLCACLSLSKVIHQNGIKYKLYHKCCISELCWPPDIQDHNHQSQKVRPMRGHCNQRTRGLVSIVIYSHGFFYYVLEIMVFFIPNKLYPSPLPFHLVLKIALRSLKMKIVYISI